MAAAQVTPLLGSAQTFAVLGAAAVSSLNAGSGDGLSWQIGSLAILGTGTAFAGNLLADESLTLNTSASIGCGPGNCLERRGGAGHPHRVKPVRRCVTSGVGLPEPRSQALLPLAWAGLAWRCRRPS